TLLFNKKDKSLGKETFFVVHNTNAPYAYTCGFAVVKPLLYSSSGYFISAERNTLNGAPCSICAVNFPEELTVSYALMPVSFLQASFNLLATNCALTATAICNCCEKEVKDTTKNREKKSSIIIIKYKCCL